MSPESRVRPLLQHMDQGLVNKCSLPALMNSQFPSGMDKGTLLSSQSEASIPHRGDLLLETLHGPEGEVLLLRDCWGRQAQNTVPA